MRTAVCRNGLQASVLDPQFFLEPGDLLDQALVLRLQSQAFVLPIRRHRAGVDKRILREGDDVLQRIPNRFRP